MDGRSTTFAREYLRFSNGKCEIAIRYGFVAAMPNRWHCACVHKETGAYIIYTDDRYGCVITYLFVCLCIFS